MSYSVKFSDLTKLSSAIIVDDGKAGSPGNNYSTSLTLIGKNASGYAEYISTNFLHLLENHASSLPPNNPIEGQLWYDNAAYKLKINDGTANGANWKSINGVYQEPAEPAEAVTGDIWVDTTSFQLKVKNENSDWILVGPAVDGSSKSGPISETVKDIAGTDRKIIANYVNGEIVEIISPNQFTPQIKIDGFESIKAGLNLTSVNSAILNATAYAAQNILVTTPVRAVINGNSFVRNDIDTSINGVINAKKGITLGIDPTFTIQKEGTFKNKFINSKRNGTFAFQISDDDNVYNEIVTINGGNKRVGINTPNPQFGLDVTGSARFSGTVTITTNADDALTISGSVAFGKNTSFSSTASFASTSTFLNGIKIGNTLTDSSSSPKEIIQPAVHQAYNLGSATKAFREVHSANFIGTLAGTSTVATRLSSSARFTMDGDIVSAGFDYGGTGAAQVFETQLQATAISNRSTVTSVASTDELLVSVSSVSFVNIPANGGSGGGAAFDIVRQSNGSYVIARVANTGSNYVIADTLTIPGTFLGGENNINDLNINVPSVNVLGSIPSNPALYTSISGIGVTGLAKASRDALLSSVLDFLIPPGTIVPYAGLSTPNPATALSKGWLFCDGSIVSNTQYPGLFAAIGFTYGKTLISGQFKLPDLRGRTIIGYDNMTNGLTSSPGVANRVVGANTPNSFSASNGTAPPVVGGSTTATMTATSFSQQYPFPTAGFGGTATGMVTTVMNPFHAMNYIIKA
jgi:microcystin-dependent protein